MARSELGSKPKITEEEWLQAGLEALGREGSDSLKIKRLAEALGVTTGSFYWHFKNVGEFHRKVLDYWIEWDTRQTVREAREDDRPMQRIEEIIERNELHLYDDAVQRWSLVNEDAARALARVEKLRCRLMTELLIRTGLDAKKAHVRAQIIVWMAGGYRHAEKNWRMEVLKALMDLVSPTEAEIRHGEQSASARIQSVSPVEK